MPYKIFRVPSWGCEESERALNSFLSNYKILTVAREFVNAGQNAFWCFCVDYLEQGSAGNTSRTNRQRGKIDYREVLDPEEFALYARLREVRKELAQPEAIPVYTICTNAQLAQIVQQRVVDKASLRGIDGLGEARVTKYGDRLLEVAKDHWKEAHETSRSTV